MTMKTLFIIFLAFSQSYATSFHCNHFFKDSFELFRMPTRQLDLLITVENKSEKATIILSECGPFNVPSKCKNQKSAPKGTKAVIYANEDSDCFFISGEGEWEYNTLLDDSKNPVVEVKQKRPEDKEFYSLAFEYVCIPNAEFDQKAIFLADVNVAKIITIGGSSCAYTFETLKLITENRILVLSFLIAIGSLLCFMGLKFFNDLFAYFLGLVVVIFVIYLCSFLFAPSMEPEMVNRYLKMAIALTLIVLGIVLLVKFTWFLVAVLSLVASYVAARIFIDLLKGVNEKVLGNQFVFYAIFIAIFICMCLIHRKFSDYFVILCSGLIGGFMLSAALMNIVSKNWEFLFNLSDLGQDINFDKVLEKRFVVFGVMFSFIGIAAQVLLFKAKKNAESTHPKDLKIELKGV